MNEDTQALNPEVEVTTPPESPTEEQTTDSETSVSTQEPVVPKKGAQSRIRELSGENRSLKDKIAELTNPVGFQAPQVPYQPQTVPQSDDGSIDPQEFKRQVMTEANQLIDFKTRQAITVQRINSQTDELVRKYEELDPENDSFNQELSDDVFEIAEAKLKADPTADIRKLVAKQIALHRRASTKEDAKTQAEIAKQAAQSAIRPTQTKPVDTPFEKKSIEEMRAHLGYAD